MVGVLDELVPEVSFSHPPPDVPADPGARSAARSRQPVRPDAAATPVRRHRRHPRRARPEPGEPAYDADRDDLVTRLREARDPETGEPISETEIRDQALIFLMAGHETTAGALTFTLHLLGRHPEIQDQVADEIRDVLGDDRCASPDQVRELAWTRAALMEGMRLFPSAHVTERSTAEPLTLGGYRLPARPDRARLAVDDAPPPGVLAGRRAVRPRSVRRRPRPAALRVLPVRRRAALVRR